MNGINIKELIESCIDDLMNNQPISKIFLKMQTISFYLKNNQFSKWFNNEKNGYKSANELPNYRKTGCEVLANIMVSYKGILTDYHIPIDQVKNTTARESLRELLFFESIIDLENLVQSNEKGSIRKYIPGFAYGEIQKLLSQGNYIETVWQTVSKSTVISIIDSVKSKILQFFLEMNEQFNNDINFDVMTKKKEIDKIVNQTINAGVYIQDGNANVSNSTVIGGQDNNITITEEVRQQVDEIIKRIEDLEQGETEIAEIICEIQQELKKKMPMPKVLKRCLQALKSFPTILAEKSIEVGLDKIITLIPSL